MDTEELGQIAALIGEPARAKMLWSLLDGKAYTATELSHFSNTSPQSASMHLSKLVQSGLLKVSIQGRYRYYSFDREEVAYAIEALGSLISKPVARQQKAEQERPIRKCRTCYDHLAGKVGVLIYERLIEKNYLFPANGKYQLTGEGESFFAHIEIDIPTLIRQRRMFAKPCLDWSERKYHLAGALGSALLDAFLNKDYIRKIANSRALLITPKGRSNLYDLLQLEL